MAGWLTAVESSFSLGPGEVCVCLGGWAGGRAGGRACNTSKQSRPGDHQQLGTSLGGRSALLLPHAPCAPPPTHPPTHPPSAQTCSRS